MPPLTVRQLLRLSKKPPTPCIPPGCPIEDSATKINEENMKIENFQIEAPLLPLNKIGKITALEAHRIECSINTIFVIPEWITEAFQIQLQQIIESHKNRDTRLRNRRVQKWGGNVTSNGLTDVEVLPNWLEIPINRLMELSLFPADHRPNHVLINLYDIDSGILPHTDGPSYYPLVCILSLGYPCIFEFHKKAKDRYPQESIAPMASLYLQPRSLLIFKEDAYHKLLHSIPDSHVEPLNECIYNLPSDLIGTYIQRGPRTSMTFRHVSIAEST